MQIENPHWKWYQNWAIKKVVVIKNITLIHLLKKQVIKAEDQSVNLIVIILMLMIILELKETLQLVINIILILVKMNNSRIKKEESQF